MVLGKINFVCLSVCQKTVHTIGEKLILPVMKKVVNKMIEKGSSKLNSHSLLNITAKRRTENMSGDVLNQIVQ